MAYSAKDIRSLGDIEQLQINPEMYIGHTEHPTHLVEECFDNACDECQTGSASIVAIKVDTKTKTYSILDNGRGIPISENTPIKITTKLYTGAKFKDKKTAYEISSGLHGVGLVAVNALSDTMSVEIYRSGKHAIFNFENAKLKNKKIVAFKESDIPFSTSLTFKPSKKIFDELDLDLERLRNRLITASIQMPDNIFVLEIDGEREIFKLNLQDYFNKYILDEGNGEIINRVQFNATEGPEKFGIVMTYSDKGSVSPKISSSVNLLPVMSGGTHVNMFYEVLRDIFTTKAKKLGYSFQPNDCLIGLRAYLMLSLKQIQFSAQIKDKLTNKKPYLEKLVSALKTQLEAYFNKNQDDLVALLEHFQAYRQKLDSKKLKTNTGANGKRSFTKFTKLRDCTSSRGEIFICEGDSAGGGLIACRNPKQHAIFPLKGKIPSAATTKDILQNKEISELMRAIGTGVNNDFDISRLRYQKIITFTDADPDGDHIASLLLLALSILTPELIKQGHVYVGQTPLYAVNEKRKFTPLWSEKELNAARKENKKIIRCKGLGEFNPSQLKTFTTDEKTRRLIQVQFTDDMNNIMKLFTSVDAKKELLGQGDEHEEND